MAYPVPISAVQISSFSMCGRFTLLLGLIAGFSLGLCFASTTEIDWEYRLIQVSWKSTDESIVRLDVRPVRIERGVYALNGTVLIGVDIDDSYLFGLKLMYSVTGSGMWTSTPFVMKPRNFYKFMNTFYKEYLDDDASSCAGTTHIGNGIYNEPFKAREVYLKNCLVNTSPMPAHMRPGYYKLVLEVTKASFEFYADVIAKIDAKQ